MPGAAYQSLKVEELQLDIPYAITISPEEQFVGYAKQTRSNVYTLPNKTFKDYVAKHLQVCKYSGYELFFEMSPVGRQHYHGFVTIKDISMFVTKDMHILRSIGAFVIKRITDEGPKGQDVNTEAGTLTWHKYCSKQSGIWGTKYNIIKLCDSE